MMLSGILILLYFWAGMVGLLFLVYKRCPRREDYVFVKYYDAYSRWIQGILLYSVSYFALVPLMAAAILSKLSPG